MGLIRDIMTAQRLVVPDEMRYDKIGPLISDNVNGQPVDSPGTTSDFLRTYATIEWVFAAIRPIQENIAKLPMKIYVDVKEGERKEITNDPRFRILQAPDPHKTKFMFWSTVIGHLKLAGEVFCYLVRANPNQPPQAIIPLRPDRVKIVPHPKEYIAGYVYDINGKKTPFEPWEMYHVALFNPTDDYRGMSPLRAAMNQMTLDLHSVTWAKDFFKHGARPSGTLEVPGTLEQASFNRIRDEFKKIYTGVGSKSQSVLVLEEGTKFNAISLPPKDMDFIEQRKMSKQAVLSVLGVPPLMVMDLTDSSVLQNTEIQKRIFWEETLVPTMAMFLDEWNHELMPLFGVPGAYAEFDTSKVTALQEPKDAKEKRYFEGFSRGAVTPNEIRTGVYGFDEMNDPAMNSTYLPMNSVPVATQSKKKL